MVNGLGHVRVDMRVRGAKGERKLENVLVDTGATFTILPRSVLEEVGAWSLQLTLPLELGDGRKVEADVYSAVIAIGDRWGPGIILTFKDAKTVLGVQALEALGLRVNPATGRLESTRPKGIAYFYQQKSALG
ncbi:MAG: aspartyl protease family protein [Candidatus Freyarchaeota archaeon]